MVIQPNRFQYNHTSNRISNTLGYITETSHLFLTNQPPGLEKTPSCFNKTSRLVLSDQLAGFCKGAGWIIQEAHLDPLPANFDKLKLGSFYVLKHMLM
jgi:hypothetical protein